MKMKSNNRVQGTLHKVSGPLTRDVGRKKEYMNKDEIITVSLRLDVGRENTILSILLAADGSIKRMGNGRFSDIDTKKELHIGAGQEQLFRDFASIIPDEIFEYAGRYDLPEPQGLPCQLTLLLQGRDDSGIGYEFNYGSESQGPPEEIQELVTTAIKITDKWLEAQNIKTPKPWWRLW